MKPYLYRVGALCIVSLFLVGCSRFIGSRPQGDAVSIFGVKYRVRDANYANQSKAAIVQNKAGKLFYRLFTPDGRIASEKAVLPTDITDLELSLPVATLASELHIFEPFAELAPAGAPFILGKYSNRPESLTVLIVRMGLQSNDYYADLVYRKPDAVTGEMRFYPSVQPLPLVDDGHGVFRSATLRIDARGDKLKYDGTITAAEIPTIPGGSVDVGGLDSFKFTNE